MATWDDHDSSVDDGGDIRIFVDDYDDGDFDELRLILILMNWCWFWWAERFKRLNAMFRKRISLHGRVPGDSYEKEIDLITFRTHFPTQP